MPANVKPSLEEYRETLLKEHGFPSSKSYELNANNARIQVMGGGFFKELSNQLITLSGVYSAAHPQFLLTHPSAKTNLLVKPYVSVLEKAYRTNVAFNRNYPKPPDEGWVDGKNFWNRLNDTLRCRIVCKYIDGPEFLSGRACCLTSGHYDGAERKDYFQGVRRSP